MDGLGLAFGYDLSERRSCDEPPNLNEGKVLFLICQQIDNLQAKDGSDACPNTAYTFAADVDSLLPC